MKGVRCTAWALSALLLVPAVGRAQEEEREATAKTQTEETAPVKKKRNWGHLSASFETNTIIYQEDSKIKNNNTTTGEKLHDYGSNNYLKIDYQLGRFSAGVQAEYYPEVLRGYDNKFDGFGVPVKYLAWTDRNYSITLGDFYEQFGSGMVLRAWEDRTLGFNNSLGGARVTFNVKDVLRAKALFAFPRLYMHYSYTQVLGGDVSLSLSRALGMRNHVLDLEGSVVNRHENRHPDDYTEENLGFQLPRNVLSWSARLNYAWKGLTAKFEYVGKGKDLIQMPLAIESELLKGNAQIAELGYSGGGFSVSATFRRMSRMQQLMERTDRLPMSNNLLNYIPALTPQHTYTLAAIEPFTPNVFGEIGGQVDLFYTFKRGSAIGGKRGMKVHANFSTYYALEGALNTELPGKHMLYRDITFDIDKTWNRRLRTVLFVSLQKIAPHVAEEYKEQNIFVGDITYKFTKKFSVRAELQYLYMSDEPAPDPLLSDPERGDWMAGVLEFSFAPKWSIYGSWTYNHGGNKIHYYSAGASFTHSFLRVAMTYGRNREGYVCSGGVCRMMPGYTGGNLQLTLTF